METRGILVRRTVSEASTMKEEDDEEKGSSNEGTTVDRSIDTEQNGTTGNMNITGNGSEIQNEQNDKDNGWIRRNPATATFNKRTVSFKHDREQETVSRCCASEKDLWSMDDEWRCSARHSLIDCEQEKLLVELYELQKVKRCGVRWTETARWIKYEERVEGVDKFWGKPQVAFLAFHSLTQLRLCFMRGVVLFDQTAASYDDLLDTLVNTMAKEYQIDPSRIPILRQAVRGNRDGKQSCPANSKSAVGFVARQVSVLARQQTVLKIDYTPSVRRSSATSADIERRNDSKPTENKKLLRMQTATELLKPQRRPTRAMTRFWNRSVDVTEMREDMDLLKRLPEGIEGVQILAGEVKELLHVRFAMVRLSEAKIFPEFHHGRVPLRFVFVLVGPPTTDLDYHEIGRSLGTLMANPNFQAIALGTQHRKDLVEAVDTFLDEGIVVPPGDIDKRVLNNVDDIKRALRHRCKSKTRHEMTGSREFGKENHVVELDKGSEKGEDEKDEENALKRTGKLFGGLIRDVRKRAPYYWSDFKDAANLQCLTSICFMFFAVFAPGITFGGLLGTKTKGWMGTSEVLVAQSLCGIIWSLFSCQPLLIMAATGPFLIFEGSLYEFCDSQGIDFMLFRVWAGFWVFLAAIITVMLEGSFLIRYFTKFTEDIFAALVALIFVVESLKFLFKSFTNHPLMNLHDYCGSWMQYSLLWDNHNSSVYYGNTTNSGENGTLDSYSILDHRPTEMKGQPDTALLSAVLVIGTFYLSYQFRQLRTTIFLGRPLRRLISDFGVPIAIFIVVIIDIFFFNESYMTHLVMSDTFSPTTPEKRGWFIWPFATDTSSFPTWAYFGAIVPALLVYILIFVECELTELLLLRPERKLQKGGGFHWDLLLLGGLTVLCSLMGLPWMCAAVLQSLAHSTSLTVMKNRAPGQPPQAHRVIEQRVTTLLISLLTGACTFLGFVLKEIPIAVLFGVFLFLGVMTLSGLEMSNRLVLTLVPQKYFPDHPFCQNVSMWRMHLYTLIQLVCLALMWLCKTIQQTSLVFPFVLMLIALVRIFLLPKMFTTDELEALDGEQELKEDEDDEVDMFRMGYMAV